MKRIKIVIAITLMLFFMTGIWLIDLGSSTLAIQRVVDVKLVAQSLTITATPSDVYHAGLIISGMCFYLLSILFIFEVLKKDVLCVNQDANVSNPVVRNSKRRSKQ